MHPTSIDATARIGEGAVLGEGGFIGPGVVIGRECRIGHGVILHADTTLGDGVRVDDYAVIGKLPLRAKRSIFQATALAPATIGARCLIGTHAVVYRGATLGEEVLVADGSSIREETSIGSLTIVGRAVSIENKCVVGRKCKIETDAYITAMTTIEDGCFIAPKVMTSNDNYLGRTEERFRHHGGPKLRRGCRVGVGAILLPGVEIGEECVVAAGSIVTRDAPARMVVMGSPAKALRPVPEREFFEE